MLIRNHVEYLTDSNAILNIIVKYEENTNNTRLSIGGLNHNPVVCGFTLERKSLTPRYVQHKSLGKIVFKTHSAWISYIQGNKDNIQSATGERINCTGLYFI